MSRGNYLPIKLCHPSALYFKKKNESPSLYSLKDGGQKSEFLSFATLFGWTYRVHIECIGRESIMIDVSAAKLWQI